MPVKRTDRLNSLLKEVLSEVIHRDIHHVKNINTFITITRVDITSDLLQAKIYISVIGKETDKQQALLALQHRAGTIARKASKKVKMRYFPELDFRFDDQLENQLHMEELFAKISQERLKRQHQDES